MPKQSHRDVREISTGTAAPSAGPYSQAVVAGQFVFCSGVTPTQPDGTPVNGSFDEQGRAAFANLQAIAEAAGCTLNNTVRVSVYLRDPARFDEMNSLFEEYLGDTKPARTTLPVALDGMEIEIDAILYRTLPTQDLQHDAKFPTLGGLGA